MKFEITFNGSKQIFLNDITSEEIVAFAEFIKKLNEKNGEKAISGLFDISDIELY